MVKKTKEKKSYIEMEIERIEKQLNDTASKIGVKEKELLSSKLTKLKSAHKRGKRFP